MKKLLIIFMFFSMLMQSCSFSYLTLENKLKPPSLGKKSGHETEEKKVKFFIKVEGRRYFMTKISEYSKEQLEEISDFYTESTKQVLLKKHFEPIEVTDKNNSDLIINIMNVPHVGAVGVEWLTGLSFGVIPSWPTREKQFIFEFENSKSPQKQKYWVNRHSFNHITVFPVFWAGLLMENHFDKYEEALNNFIENEKI